MLLVNRRAAVEICNGAGEFEDAGIRPGGETEAVGDQFQHAITGGVQFTVFLDETRSHLGIAVDFGTFVALKLEFPRTLYPLSNGRGTFRFSPVRKVAILDSRDLDVDVDTVEQRPGDARPVVMNSHRGAGAGVGRIGKVAAGTGVCATFSTIVTQNGTHSQFKFPAKNEWILASS